MLIDVHSGWNSTCQRGQRTKLLLTTWFLRLVGDSSANYSLRVGMLGGKVGNELGFQQLIVNPFICDSIIISQEPVDDTNLNPSTPCR